MVLGAFAVLCFAVWIALLIRSTTASQAADPAQAGRGRRLNLAFAAATLVAAQVKPTVIYMIFGLALLIGVWRGTSLLKYLLEAAFDGLDDAGWLILSRNWGYFFFFLAALNEGFRHYLTFGGWLQAKLYVFLPLTFVFTFLHMPMLLRHGMGEEGKEEALGNPPHE